MGVLTVIRFKKNIHLIHTFHLHVYVTFLVQCCSIGLETQLFIHSFEPSPFITQQQMTSEKKYFLFFISVDEGHIKTHSILNFKIQNSFRYICMHSFEPSTFITQQQMTPSKKHF